MDIPKVNLKVTKIITPPASPMRQSDICAVEHHKKKSAEFLTPFFDAAAMGDLQAFQNLCHKISAELTTVKHLLCWDPAAAKLAAGKIDPPISEENLEQLKDTGYAPMARYLLAGRNNTPPLESRAMRQSVIDILNEAEKFGANSACISSIRDRCPPISYDSCIVEHRLESLAYLDCILSAITRENADNLVSIHGPLMKANAMFATGCLINDDVDKAKKEAGKSSPPVEDKYLDDLKGTAYVPIVQYLCLVQEELTASNDKRKAYVDMFRMPEYREEIREFLLLAQECGANPKYVNALGNMLMESGLT